MVDPSIDIAEVCNGTSDCPDDSFNNSTTLCRASAGTCGIRERIETKGRRKDKIIHSETSDAFYS